MENATLQGKSSLKQHAYFFFSLKKTVEVFLK